MKKSSKQLQKRVLTVLVLFLLLGSGVFAWIYGNVTPEITGDFKIGAMPGLKFNIDTGSTSLIDLNSAYGIATESLNLNEVSSPDGKTFLARDTAQLFMESGNPGGNQEVITFRTAEVNQVTETTQGETKIRSITGDYMDVEFTMLLDYTDTEEAEYYIYFLNGLWEGAVYQCGFTGGTNADGTNATTTENGLKALRVCLRVSDATGYGPEMTQDSENTSEYYAIFGNASESSGSYHNQTVSATESVSLKLTNDATSETKQIAGSYYINYLTGITDWPHTFGTLTSVDVHSFASCSLSQSTLNDSLEGTAVPEANYLFKMDNNNNSVDITMRVWLEGGSEYCVNGQIVPEDAINLNLYFVAYKVKASE